MPKKFHFKSFMLQSMMLGSKLINALLMSKRIFGAFTGRSYSNQLLLQVFVYAIHSIQPSFNRFLFYDWSFIKFFFFLKSVTMNSFPDNCSGTNLSFHKIEREPSSIRIISFTLAQFSLRAREPMTTMIKPRHRTRPATTHIHSRPCTSKLILPAHPCLGFPSPGDLFPPGLPVVTPNAVRPS